MARLMLRATPVMPAPEPWFRLAPSSDFLGGGGWASNTHHAIYFNGKTYVGFVDLDGRVHVLSYDHATHAIVTSPTILSIGADLHNAPSLVVRASDSRLVLAVAGHDSTSLFIAISTNPEDVSAWGSATNIDGSLGGTAYTYCNLFQLSSESNKLYLFYRDYVSGTGTGSICYSTSTDGGATWSAQTNLWSVSGVVSYTVAGSDNSSRIDIAVTDGNAQDGETASLYHFYYSGGSFFKSDATTITASKPYGPSSVTKVYDGATNGSVGYAPASIVTNSGNPIATWSSFPAAGQTNSNYWYGTYSAGTWTVNKIDDSGVAPSIPYGDGSTAIDRIDPTRVYVARVVSGLEQMFLYQTSNSGSTWTTTQLTDDTTGEHNQRAISPVNANSGLRAIWMCGWLAPDTSSPTFSTQLRGYPNA